MPAKINLLNQRFGKLVVLEETEKRKNGSVIWKCKCDCDNIVYFSTKELRSDGLIQCHQCGNKRQPKVNLIDNIIGKKFNFLTVLQKTEKTKGGKILYKCLCDCGNYIQTDRTQLQNGNTKSCGCIRFKYKVGDIINNKQIIELNPNIPQNKNKKRHYYKCKCLLCGNEYYTMGQSLQKTTGCGCLKSIGEQNIQTILIENQVPFIKQYSFPNSSYRFDFAILNQQKKIIRLIQFDGQQHYLTNVKQSGWNTLQRYQITYKHDIQKNKLALDLQIPLIRIPYWERYNITIEMLLKDEKYIIKGV